MTTVRSAASTILLISSWAGAQSPNPAAPLTWDNVETRLQQEADAGFSGVCLLARNGKIVLHKAYGMADRDKQIPITTSTIFAIGSTPIDFTKAGILLLAERGKLSLSDPITKFFDNVPEDKKTITIEHLMTGQSGLEDFHDVPGDRDPDHSWIDRSTAIKRILHKKLLFEPGQSREHSHSAWGLLAAVIEIVSGQSYPDFTREHLFKPAGMSDTGFFGEPIAAERMAIGYGPRKDGEINAPPYWGKTSWLVMGSGGQTSTAEDMYRWVRALREGKILSTESLSHYFGPQGNVLAGGDMYGFEIVYTDGPESMMIIITNSGSPLRQERWESFTEELANLANGRTPPMFALGVEFKLDPGQPVTIQKVHPNSAAARDGLKDGDVILSVNDQPVSDNLRELLEPYLQSGQPIPFEVKRESEKTKIIVTPKAK